MIPDERGAFCWNSRVWLYLRGFRRPPTCANQKDFEEHACRGCAYFEIRTSEYLERRLRQVERAS